MANPRVAIWYQKYKRPYIPHTVSPCPICNGTHKYEIVANRRQAELSPETEEITDNQFRCPVENKSYKDKVTVEKIPGTRVWSFMAYLVGEKGPER